jgi:hypothetical protein
VQPDPDGPSGRAVVVGDGPAVVTVVVAGVAIVVWWVVVVVTVGSVVVTADVVIPASPPLDPEQAVTRASAISRTFSTFPTRSAVAGEEIDDGLCVEGGTGMLAHAFLLPDG